MNYWILPGVQLEARNSIMCSYTHFESSFPFYLIKKPLVVDVYRKVLFVHVLAFVLLSTHKFDKVVKRLILFAGVQRENKHVVHREVHKWYYFSKANQLFELNCFNVLLYVCSDDLKASNKLCLRKMFIDHVSEYLTDENRLVGCLVDFEDFIKHKLKDDIIFYLIEAVVLCCKQLIDYHGWIWLVCNHHLADKVIYQIEVYGSSSSKTFGISILEEESHAWEHCVYIWDCIISTDGKLKCFADMFRWSAGITKRKGIALADPFWRWDVSDGCWKEVICEFILRTWLSQLILHEFSNIIEDVPEFHFVFLN